LTNEEYLAFWNSPIESRRHELIAGPVPWDQALQLAKDHVGMIVTPLIERELFPHWESSKVPKEGRAVLEWGCGHGRVMGEFLKRGERNLIGVDISKEMIDAAGEHITSVSEAHSRKETTRVDLRITSASMGSYLNLTDLFSTVDFAYSFLVFQHMPSRDCVNLALKALWQLLKPGGIARIQTMKGKPHPETSFGGFHGHFFESLGEFEQAASGSKFDVLEAQEDLGHHGWLWLTLKKPIS
jgi:SAM-dependent methyltransferase